MLTSAGVPPDLSTFMVDYLKYALLPWLAGILVMTRCRYHRRRADRVYKASG